MTNTTQTTLELTIIKHWIGGKPYEGSVERWGDVYNPATGESNTRVAFASEATVERRVAWGRAWEAGGAPSYWPRRPRARSCSRASGRRTAASSTPTRR